MENDILDSLNDLGYEGPMSEETSFLKALDGGPKSLEYTKLVHILSNELKQLCNLEETVNMMNDPEESSSFLLELSSFLKELGCPYKKLITGHMSSRLQSKEDRILLLDYLISELMAARMINIDQPKDTSSSMEIVMQESPTANDLKNILIALKFNKPPPNITPEILFAKLEAKLKDCIQKEGWNVEANFSNTSKAFKQQSESQPENRGSIKSLTNLSLQVLLENMTEKNNLVNPKNLIWKIFKQRNFKKCLKKNKIIIDVSKKSCMQSKDNNMPDGTEREFASTNYQDSTNPVINECLQITSCDINSIINLQDSCVLHKISDRTENMNNKLDKELNNMQEKISDLNIQQDVPHFDDLDCFIVETESNVIDLTSPLVKKKRLLSDDHDSEAKRAKYNKMETDLTLDPVSNMKLLSRNKTSTNKQLFQTVEMKAKNKNKIGNDVTSSAISGLFKQDYFNWTPYEYTDFTADTNALEVLLLNSSFVIYNEKKVSYFDQDSIVPNKNENIDKYQQGSFVSNSKGSANYLNINPYNRANTKTAKLIMPTKNINPIVVESKLLAGNRVAKKKNRKRAEKRRVKAMLLVMDKENASNVNNQSDHYLHAKPNQTIAAASPSGNVGLPIQKNSDLFQHNYNSDINLKGTTQQQNQQIPSTIVNSPIVDHYLHGKPNQIMTTALPTENVALRIHKNHNIFQHNYNSNINFRGNSQQQNQKIPSPIDTNGVKSSTGKRSKKNKSLKSQEKATVNIVQTHNVQSAVVTNKIQSPHDPLLISNNKQGNTANTCQIRSTKHPKTLQCIQQNLIKGMNNHVSKVYKEASKKFEQKSIASYSAVKTKTTLHAEQIATMALQKSTIQPDLEANKTFEYLKNDKNQIIAINKRCDPNRQQIKQKYYMPNVVLPSKSVLPATNSKTKSLNNTFNKTLLKKSEIFGQVQSLCGTNQITNSTTLLIMENTNQEQMRGVPDGPSTSAANNSYSFTNNNAQEMVLMTPTIIENMNDNLMHLNRASSTLSNETMPKNSTKANVSKHLENNNANNEIAFRTRLPSAVTQRDEDVEPSKSAINVNITKTATVSCKKYSIIHSTKKCPRMVKQQTKTKLHVKALIVNRDRLPLSKDQASLIRNALQSYIGSYFSDHKYEQSFRMPAFDCFPNMENGGIRFYCANNFTFQWLKTAVKKLDGVWKGASFVILRKLFYAKGVIHAPKFFGNDVAQLKQSLEASNPEYNIKDWVVINHIMYGAGERKDFMVVFKIPMAEVNILKKNKCRLYYLLGTLVLKF